MSLNIKQTGISLTSELSQYLDKKLEDVEKLIDSSDTSVQLYVELGKLTEHHQNGVVYKAEFNLHTSGNDFYVVGKGETLYAALDEAKDQLVSELRVAKRKRLHFIRKGGAKLKGLLKGFRSRD